jgi:hypothetical protein
MRRLSTTGPTPIDRLREGAYIGERSFLQEGHMRGWIGQGEGLPDWWRHGRAERCTTLFERLPADIERRWLMVDLCLTAALALLCVGVGVAVS